MGWFKVDDQLAFHSKTVMAGNAAMGLWVRAGAWASAQLTDGYVAKHMANAMAKPEDADALVMAGLWDEVEGGYQFHDWGDFQPDAIDEKRRREEVRKVRSEAGKAGAAARWGDKTPDGKHGKTDGKPKAKSKQTDSKPMAPSRPDQNLTEAKASVAASRATRIPPDWQPVPQLIADMAAECPTVDQRAEHRKFVDYYLAKAGRDGTKANWPATYRNWIRNAEKFAPKSANRATDRMRAGYEAMAGYQGPTEDPWARPKEIAS